VNPDATSNQPTDDAATASTHDQAAYRPAQAAQRLGISRSTLYEELRTGRLHARKIGNATVITADEIDRYLATLPQWHANTR
jgi:excisionase family DNA binding protein